MSVIVRQDTNGVKPLLQVGELGYDNYPAGGDEGRVYVGTGTSNIAQAKQSEVVAVDSKVDAHAARTDNPHGVTKAQVGLGNVDNTSDADKPISIATQDALNLKVDDSEIASVNLLRADKYLAAQSVASMGYSVEGKLVKVQYNNAVDENYELLSYNAEGKLSNVAHYVDTVLKGNTALGYSAGKLVSAIYIEI